MRLLIVWGLLLSLFLKPASAQMSAAEFNLPENIAQAGLAQGMVPVGSKVLQDGRPLPVLEDGRFLFAAAQMAKGSTTLKITFPSGKQGAYSIPIEQREWPVQRINGLPGDMVTPPASVLKRINSDNAAIGRTRQRLTKESLFDTGFMYPTTGTKSGVFGSRRILNGVEKQPHRGLDIAAPIGTPIVAPADGVIVLTHEDMYYTGKTLMIDHGYGLMSIMIHLNKIAVQNGQRVRQGDALGEVGKTGRATGPHLHWGMSLGNIAIDPEAVLALLPASGAVVPSP
jgi:murein DD-endopeptidase MepM/ murein hydrolase activator NlpD